MSMAWHGYGMARNGRGMVWHGMVFGMAWHSRGMVWHVMVWHGRGMA